jgi:hypothetical protein
VPFGTVPSRGKAQASGLPPNANTLPEAGVSPQRAGLLRKYTGGADGNANCFFPLKGAYPPGPPASGGNLTSQSEPLAPPRLRGGRGVKILYDFQPPWVTRSVKNDCSENPQAGRLCHIPRAVALDLTRSLRKECGTAVSAVKGCVATILSSSMGVAKPHEGLSPDFVVPKGWVSVLVAVSICLLWGNFRY